MFHCIVVAKFIDTYMWLYICVTNLVKTDVDISNRIHMILSAPMPIWIIPPEGMRTPLWKSNRNVFSESNLIELLDINRLCLVCIKRSTEEVKKCQISKHGYHQGPSDETLKKARCQFCDVKFGHRIMEAVGVFFAIKCIVLSKLLLISQISQARVLFDDLRRWFCISDVFVNYKLLNKSKSEAKIALLSPAEGYDQIWIPT